MICATLLGQSCARDNDRDMAICFLVSRLITWLGLMHETHLPPTAAQVHSDHDHQAMKKLAKVGSRW